MSTGAPRKDDLNQSDIASARLSPPREDEEGRGDVLTGGDATKAPHSLSEVERRPIEGASSGTSWDDPDEL
ncbi:hypothetical protein [Cellulosimicrobium marinum]|uniref:hypothetical protein n=1 Tax=Cellulosimicrobium marinum TaxID=1638992 RepID=UPI001E2B637F|nr:hypothetical protein [Cellulosimicrobium marinum]MCB7138093.1 hypothetical protein [Cellulosimicrobium marinum]